MTAGVPARPAPTAHARLTGLGFEVVAAGPEEFRARAEAATARFAGVVRRITPPGQGG